MAAASALPLISSLTSIGVASCGSSDRAVFSPITDWVAIAIGTIAGIRRKYARKFRTMNPCAASFGSRSGNCSRYCSIWPSWFGSRSLTWMKATIAVGMAAKIRAGKTTAPRRRRFDRRSRASLTRTAQMNPGRIRPLPVPMCAASRVAASPTRSR